MVAKLHQILAAERGVSAETERLLSLAVQGLGVTGEQSPLSGLSRTYEPRAEETDTFPAVSQKVQIRVEHEVMPMIADSLTRLIDLRATRDEANTHARADVVVGGKVLFPQVPTTQLLSLENELGRLRQLITQLPVLDPAEAWRWDKNRNAYAGAERRKVREVRVPQYQVMYEAVVRDGVGVPAQIRQYETNRPVGEWVETRFSGAMPAETREEILRRLAELATALKYARESANRIDTEQVRVGKPLFDFLFTGVLPSQASTDSTSS